VGYHQLSRGCSTYLRGVARIRQAAEAAAAAAKQEATLAGLAAAARMAAVADLTQEVEALQVQLSSAMTAEEVAELEPALNIAMAEMAAAAEARAQTAEEDAAEAKLKAAMAEAAAATRQEAVWTLSNKVNELEHQVRVLLFWAGTEALLCRM
jgi:phosphoribosylanthranilate isomerase